MTYLDSDGYPTQEYLEWITDYQTDAFHNWTDFIQTIIDNWQYKGYKFSRVYKGKRTLVLHTCGWSGNEEIMGALEKNEWFFFMFHTKWIRGGHWYFEIPVK